MNEGFTVQSDIDLIHKVPASSEAELSQYRMAQGSALHCIGIHVMVCGRKSDL